MNFTLTDSAKDKLEELKSRQQPIKLAITGYS